MNLIEAIKSGRPFRRKGISRSGRKPEFCWMKVVSSDIGGYSDSHFSYSEPRDDGSPCEGIEVLSPEEIVADDWEIQEPSVTITKAQFWEAVKQTYEEALLRGDHNFVTYGEAYMSKLAQRLSLE